MTDLTGRTAIVTGGGTGVGAAIAARLAGAGASVVIAGRRRDILENIASGNSAIRPFACDVTSEADITDLFAFAGDVDIVIANAGVAESAPLKRTSLESFERTVSVNLAGVFLTFRAGLPTMETRGWGRLIAIASTAGLKGYAYVAPYCAAKHGVIGLTRALALEVARSGITVNALCPGFIDTPMTDRSVANIAAKTGRSEADARRDLERINPMGRLITPDEVAATALFLCTPEAASINGQAIAISGGEL